MLQTEKITVLLRDGSEYRKNEEKKGGSMEKYRGRAEQEGSDIKKPGHALSTYPVN